VVLALPWAVAAQTVGDTFRQVSPAVVVIRATGRDVSGSGEVRFSEIGSGVLVSQDGNVMIAAHVVHAMDEIRVESWAAKSSRHMSFLPGLLPISHF
jgi:hypothetical protein